MIILLFIICVAIFIAGIKLYSDYDWDDLGIAIGVIGGLLGIACIIIAIILACYASSASVIDERIQMYTEENAKIEQQMADIVAQYQEYEHDIITEVAPDSSVALVSLYPDLKSDTLVQSQIGIYIANNEKIKQLKDDAIYAPVYRWWLYFGK